MVHACDLFFFGGASLPIRMIFLSEPYSEALGSGNSHQRARSLKNPKDKNT